MNDHQLYRAITGEYDVSFYFVYEKKRSADWNFQQYRIPAMTFWYIIEGSRRLIVSGREYSVEPANIVALPSHATVTTCHIGSEDVPIHYLSMGIQAIIGGIDWTDLYGIPTVMPVSPGGEPNELKRVWLELKDDVSRLQRLASVPPDSMLSADHTSLALSLESRLKLWLSLMTRIARPHMSTPVPATDRRVREICSYIRMNYNKPFLSEELARAVCLSEGHMRAIFRQAMGMSPHQYTLRVRLEKAKEMLITTELSLSEIAGKVGFEDVSYFISTFRKRENVTPALYRKKINPWGEK